MSLYIPTNSLSKFLTSNEFDSEQGETISYVEPLHITTKYLDCKAAYLKALNRSSEDVEKHHSKLSRPPYWDTDLNVL